MEVTGYGVTLASLKVNQIEMVRLWRNGNAISRYMEYREHITAAMQQNWFNGLRPLHDWYFVVFYLDEPIGLIHTSNIDWASKSGDAGLFIADERYLGTHVPVLASLSMVDALFSITPLQQMYAKVMQNNEVAANYNQKLGFQMMGNQNDKSFQQYLLTKESYTKASEPLRKMARHISNQQLQVSLNEDEYQLMQQNQLLVTTGSWVQLQVDGQSIAL